MLERGDSSGTASPLECPSQWERGLQNILLAKIGTNLRMQLQVAISHEMEASVNRKAMHALRPPTHLTLSPYTRNEHEFGVERMCN